MADRAEEGKIGIEVAYAGRDEQHLIPLCVPPGTTVKAALALADALPLAARERLPVGVWGRPVSRAHELQDGDRVELYRELVVDPRDARRERAAVRRRGAKETR